ncbi:class I SAM-dependent methyltransferase [Actinomadura sp. HBU206391]|uniref:class I SAM-dependent methyltransferase n=1 Tax=Actinomadura sp. HBU206391 TaxID=2731692 RepID=UPI0016508E23|nr:class I SAM-dependent methyltransferase [Actinomadura sp. HBU206391]MBC6458243.1 class I SAM-dependent methyltransferase [Actinomadura sp. HBU206391]
MADLREAWRADRLRAMVYDFGVRTYPINAVGARLLWGYDVKRLSRTIGRLSGEPDDVTVLDLPCGGGVAFAALSRGRRLHYVAADLSPIMLDRARANARRRGLDQVEFVQTDAGSLPFADRSFDVCVTLNGLHCLADPAGAVAEFARVLRPGGTLRGTTIVTGTGGRRDKLVGAFQRRGYFGPSGHADDLGRWLTSAGLTDSEIDVDGAVATFTARRPR